MLKYFNKVYPGKENALPKNSINDFCYHKMELTELKEAFNTDFVNGLGSKLVKIIQDETGKNSINSSNSAIWTKMMQNFFGGFLALLWFAFVLSILLYRPLGDGSLSSLIQGIVILIIILISGCATTYQDFSTLKAMKSFQNLGGNRAHAIRDGVKIKISNTELVVGDLILLKNGARVPADCRIIEAENLKLDKSMLTGESDPINATPEKCVNTLVSYTEAPNIGFMTSLIVSGKGKAIVVATGKNTLISSISKMTVTNDAKKSTMLQRDLNRFSFIILGAVIVTIIVVVIIWAAWQRTLGPEFDIVYLMSITITFIISYLPLGLPMAMTLALILDSNKLKKDQVLVKNLTAAETLSSVNVIASDKTGTLTQNKMYVAGLSCGTASVDIDACFCNSTIYIGDMLGIRQLLAASFICNNAKVNRDIRRGNATDIALLGFAKTNINTLELKGAYKICNEIKFNSKNKYHMMVVEPKDKSGHEELFGKSKGERMMIVKGAFDILINKCKTCIRSDGSVSELQEQDLNKLINLHNYWCSIGRRCILVCKRQSSDRENIEDYEEFLNEECNDLCALGLFSLIDPPKEGMYDVIKTCRKAGIRILMITGDFAITAQSISEQVGIYTRSRTLDTLETLRSNDLYRDTSKYFSMNAKEKDNPVNQNKVKLYGAISLTGKDLDQMSKKEWNLVCNYYEEIIISRTTPEHKLKVIKEFQENGYIIGMTGDGLNDAPALKTANIGISMGNGNEVAIEASHVVLLDNNFMSITRAIENGRLLFDNLRKVILFMMPACLCTEIVSTIVNIILGTPPTLSAYEMIIICVITDVIPSLSLVFEKPESDLMNRPPRARNDYLVSWKMLFHGFIIVGMFMTIFSMALFFWNLYELGGFALSDLFFCFSCWQDQFKGFTGDQLNNFLAEAQSTSFMSVVIMQSIGNLYGMRTRFASLYTTFPARRKYRNFYMFLSSLITIILAVIIVYVPFMNNLLTTSPVKFKYVLISIGFAFFLVLYEEMRKFLIKRDMFPSILTW